MISFNLFNPGIIFRIDEKDPIFFNGSTWVSEYPWKSPGANTFVVNGEEIKLQFYFIDAPRTNMSANWNELKGYLGVS